MGCEFRGQEGSHRKYKKAGIPRPIIVPARKELPDLVIQTNLRTLGVSKDFFVKKIRNFR